MKLLLVEDDPRLCESLQTALGNAGLTTDVLATAGDADAMLQATRYDAVVLDLGLPDGDGLNVLRKMRARGDGTPVLVLPGRGSLRERVTGFEAGADDYAVKPFPLEELIARLHALLRRPGHLLGVSLTLGNVMFDTTGRQVLVDGEPRILSSRELAILEMLMRRHGRVVPKKILENNLFSMSDEVGSNAVEVYVHRLRKHLGQFGASVQIHTLRGVGYMITATDEDGGSTSAGQPA